MKKFTFFIVISLFFPVLLFSQIIYSSKIDSVINLMSSQRMSRYVKELCGDTIIAIGGLPYGIYSRHASSPANQMAAQYIYEKFQSFGIPVRYQANNSHNVNVIARKTGYLYPNMKVLIGAHYDNIRPGIGPLDTMKGADDNGSGVAAVLESARLLANYNPKYTIEFITFDEEEIGLLGAYGYADTCEHNPNEFVIGLINMDMIAWDSNNDGLIRIMTSQGCDYLADMLIRTYSMYNLNLTPLKVFNAAGSDHMAFWNHGIGAISSIEPASDFHPYYHTIGDVFSLFNMNFFMKNSKANLAAVMSIADRLFYLINHNQIQSSFDTAGRVIDAAIVFGVPVGTGIKAPRVYYKAGNGAYSFVNAFEVVDEIYRFRIPGHPSGTQISYYIAAQDTSGNYLVSLPAGASGVNPPGSTPPPQIFRYFVHSSNTIVSNNQKQILDNQYTRDTIYIPFAGSVQDIKVNLNINHTNDGDLLITLMKDNYVCHLSQFNGDNGQNFTNTTFHDTAALSITQGTPPFTGMYRPQQQFSNINNAQTQGYWILRIYDMRAGNTGTLLNWSLTLKYSSPISVKKVEEVTASKYELFQNYPNPFNPSTKIKFKIPSSEGYGFSRGVCLVTLKVFDITGREVQTLINENLQAGTYEVTFDGSGLSSGMYFYQLRAGNFIATKKFVLMK
ncbi:MAG: M28 family peptidase [Ignavibacteria bacterium]|jgi:subtilisin-like proprotein convertase family protein|nr:M28 family peptidase [Ignavibacteria bacterium]